MSSSEVILQIGHWVDSNTCSTFESEDLVPLVESDSEEEVPPPPKTSDFESKWRILIKRIFAGVAASNIVFGLVSLFFVERLMDLTLKMVLELESDQVEIVKVSKQKFCWYVIFR